MITAQIVQHHYDDLIMGDNWYSMSPIWYMHFYENNFQIIQDSTEYRFQKTILDLVSDKLITESSTLVFTYAWSQNAIFIISSYLKITISCIVEDNNMLQDSSSLFTTLRLRCWLKREEYLLRSAAESLFSDPFEFLVTISGSNSRHRCSTSIINCETLYSALKISAGVKYHAWL